MNLGYVYFNSKKAMSYKVTVCCSFCTISHLNFQEQLENNCRQELTIDFTQWFEKTKLRPKIPLK